MSPSIPKAGFGNRPAEMIEATVKRGWVGEEDSPLGRVPGCEVDDSGAGDDWSVSASGRQYKWIA